MQITPDTERRKHQRHPMATSVEFFHGPTRRSFPGRSVDLSTGGMLMSVPASTPVQPGQAIQVSVGSVNRPEFSGLNEKPLDATIVRVDRQPLLSKGQIAVGVRFAALS